MRSRVLPLLLLILLVSFGPPLAPVWAQDEDEPKKPKAKPNLDKLLLAAYSLRRQGKLEPAAAAIETILPHMPVKTRKQSSDKAALIKELGDLYRVAGKDRKELLTYRRYALFDHELDVLLRMGKADDALKVCQRMLKTKRFKESEPVYRARVLVSKGQTDAALKALEATGKFKRERAELLIKLQRFDDAVKLFEELQDFYGKARALKGTTRTRDTSRAYSDAVSQIEFHLKSKLLPAIQKLKAVIKSAKRPVQVEYLRLLFASRLLGVAAGYRRLAECHAGSGKYEKAVTRGKQALKFYRSARARLEDKGQCAFGKLAATKVYDLDTLTQALEDEISSYESQVGGE